jgi:hypothetical protein
MLFQPFSSLNLHRLGGWKMIAVDEKMFPDHSGAYRQKILSSGFTIEKLRAASVR